jgi:hypothetical protein
VLSGGTLIDNASGQELVLDDLRPNAALTSVTANVVEDETGFAPNWSVSAYAICATPPPGLERVANTSPLNSSTKSVSVSCPGAKRVLGAGADVNTFTGEVLLDDIRPNGSLTSVTVHAVEDETGNPFNWSVTAYAVCADPIAGLERISESTPIDVSQNKILFPSCPNGKVMTGIGADANTFNGQVHFNGLFFGGSQNILLSATTDENGNPLPWGATAYVICAPGSHRIVQTSFADSGPKNVNTACETPGHQVTGGGGAVIGGFSEVVLARFRRDPVNNWLATAFEDDGGFAGSWQLRSYAICATPLPGQEIVSNSSAQTSVPKSVTATCPGDKRVVGVAGEVSDGLGQVLLDDMRPNPGLQSVTVTGVEDDTGTGISWAVSARAICADPPPGLERVAANSPVDSSPKTVPLSCPAGKNLLSTGFEIHTFTGEVLLDSLAPNDELTGATVTAVEDLSGNPFGWGLTGYGICAAT